MFHQSHYRKSGKELGLDAKAYEREYNHFLARLKKFHESKGSTFRRLPWVGGQFLDLYLLYKKVTSYGGWIKVTEDKRWGEIAEFFNLPSSCTNAAFALRQHYSRYLETFERINFFGEDAEDIVSGSRPHTPIIASPMTGTVEYDRPAPVDITKNFEKLVLSLQCGLPNEVDFAINICMLLSNVNNSVFNLTKAPAVIDMLMGHVGIYAHGSHGLQDVYSEWYQKTERDYTKFWRETLEVEDFRDLLCNGEGKSEDSDEIQLFNPGKKYGINTVEAQRVAQVCTIMYNFSFDETNAGILASNPLCLRFLMLCICNQIAYLQNLAWNTLANLAEKMKLDPVECENTQLIFQVLHYFLDDKDRFKIVKAMDVFGKLCIREDNDEVIELAIESQAYESLVRILIIPDVQLVIGSLEALYNISGVGQTTSDQIASVDRSVDILVCMVTLDAENFGAQALSEVLIIENRLPGSLGMTPRPRPTHTSPGAGSPVSPHPPSMQSSRNEIDAEAFTLRWLQSTYEAIPNGTVSRIDLYADYLSSCSRLARIGILNASAFNRIVKYVFPDVQLRRFPSGNQLQYALCGIRRRSNPLPVQSTIDQTPTTPTRIPTPPMAGRNSPNWTPGMPQRPVNMTRQAPPSPTGMHNQGNTPLRRPSFQGVPGMVNDGNRQFTPQRPMVTPNQPSIQRPGMSGQQQQWQQQNYQQQAMVPRPPQQPLQPGMLPQGSQQLIRPQPQQPARVPQMPNMVARPGSPGQQRLAPRPPMYQQPGLVPIRPAPPVTSIQSPAPVSSQPGPGPNNRTHNGPIPMDSQAPNQFRPQRPGQDPSQFQGFRPQSPQAFMGQARQAVPFQGSGGYRGNQPIAIAPKPTNNTSSSINISNPRSSSDGIVLIAREEKAEDILTSDLLKNAEEQKIIVVENTNSIQKKANSEQENGDHENNSEERSTLKRGHKNKHANLNSEGLVNTNGINGSKRTRLDDNNDSELGDPSLDEPLVNGDIRNDPRNKLMDKLLGKDIRLPNGVCDINSSDLELMTTEGERLSGSNSKTSSPDIFDSENNSDFGKYLEESDTDTGLFSDVILGDLRIDSVDPDPKNKTNDSSKSIPSLPDLGYHAVAQELRNPTALPVRPTNETSVPNKGFPNNIHEKGPITSANRPIQPRAPIPNDVISSRYGNDGFQGRPTSTWNGSPRPMLPPPYNAVNQNSSGPRPPAQQQLNAILEHRTKALVTPKMPITTDQQGNRQQTPPQQTMAHQVQMPTQQVQTSAQQMPMQQVQMPPQQMPTQQMQMALQPVQMPAQPQLQQQQQQQPVSQVGVSMNATVTDSSQPVQAPMQPSIPNQQEQQPIDAQAMKPYRCRWADCTSSFDSSKQLFGHVVSTHVPKDTLVMSCMWENCPSVRRSRSSLLFHLQQKHSDPTPVTPGAPPTPQTQGSPAQPPPQAAQPPMSNQQNPSSYIPAYQLLSRMISALQEEEESPLTKTIRLTSALVLRNIAQYSAIARSHLRRHERLLSEVAMSHSEAAHAVAACLSELSPHRKTSEDDSNTFIWAFDR